MAGNQGEQLCGKLTKAAEVLKFLEEKSSSVEAIQSGISTYKLPLLLSIINYMENQKITIENVDADTLAKKIAAEIEPKLSLVGITVSGPQTTLGPLNYERLAGEIARRMSIPSARTPYIKLEAEWTYPDPDIDKKNIDVINDVFQKISDEWEPLGHYVIEGERREYKGKIELTDDDENVLDEEETLDTSMFFKNRASSNLSLGVETDLNSYDLNLHLTSFHPEFIQGVHDLEKHFEKKDTREFVKLLNYLEKQYYENGERKTKDDISVVEYADLYEKWSP